MNPDIDSLEHERQIGFRHSPNTGKARKRIGRVEEKNVDEKLLRLWEEMEERLDKLERGNQGTKAAQSSVQSSQKKGDQSDPKTDQRSAQKSPGFVGSDHSYQREIELNNAHPKYTQKVQPDIYRGIDQRKYSKLVRIAKKVLGEKGTYNKSLIARKVPMSRTTVTRYLNVALEKGDLVG